MAILRPTDDEVAALAPEQPIMVDSDAADNAHAVLEIERWCRERGLARVRENWLRRVQTPDGPVRRGVCFRPAGDIGEEYSELLDVINRHVESMPETTSSVELRRG